MFYYLPEDNKHAQMIRGAVAKDGPDHIYQIRRAEIRTCRENICPTLTANMGAGGHNVPFIIDQFGIRQLTESECLKLQGYKLNEINFPKNLLHSQKYSMIGNAIYPEVASMIMKSLDYSGIRETYNDRLVLSA